MGGALRVGQARTLQPRVAQPCNPTWGPASCNPTRDPASCNPARGTACNPARGTACRRTRGPVCTPTWQVEDAFLRVGLDLSGNVDKLPGVKTFLNRMLGVDVDTQAP